MRWQDLEKAMRSSPRRGLAEIEACKAFGRRPSVRNLGRMVQHGKPFLVLARTGADLEAFGDELVRHGYRLLIPWVLSHARLSEHMKDGEVFVVDIEQWNAAPCRAFDLSADGGVLPTSKGDGDAPTP